MPKALVVVESPAKAKTINKYLGRDYKVVASMGHVRDLPKSKLGVDVDDGFTPDYEVIPARKKVLGEIREAAKGITDIYVATDPDREGEAIGWHLAAELAGKKRKIRRLMFNEITKTAVQEALKHPLEIDMRMVDAQQARRVLDRLVGYKISPLLWDKVRRGLSAGRVQSVALKLVCVREREIQAFVPEEYWHLFARLAGAAPPEFDAKLVKIKGETAKVTNGDEAKAHLAALDGQPFVVSSVATRERKRQAAPPFITSKLQQTARFAVKKTMMIAQQLYEGIELPGEDGPVGLITYMRTDSTRVSDQALDEVRGLIADRFGDAYLPDKPNVYKSKANAQDAHEAIRPTSVLRDPQSVRTYLTADQYSLYRLIWNRFVASQMLPALFDETTVDITAADYVFRVKGSVPKFSGWMAVLGSTTAEETSEALAPSPVRAGGAEADEDEPSGVLPPLAEGDVLELRALRPEQKFTQPPPRFSEATLVKELEENGIGRPSTYASILGTLQDRDYVVKLEGRFKPTYLGFIIHDILIRNFDDILDVEYTAKMEEQLDDIEHGRADYAGTLEAFYKKFKKDLGNFSADDYKGEGKATDEKCEKCGSPMVIKVGRFGPFMACSTYPDCTSTKELETQEVSEGSEDGEPEPCENCGKPMVLKRGRFGQFLACAGYPECKTTRKLLATKGGLKAAKPDQILDEKCPRCGSNLVIKQGRFGEFTACTNYPECKYVKLKSTGVTCPKDGGDVVERKSKRGKAFYGCANYPDCDFTLWKRPTPEPCPQCAAPYLVERITKKLGRQLVCEKCEYARSEELATA
jgi:DNA topoisomerase-1